jgi:hypothetical protein
MPRGPRLERTLSAISLEAVILFFFSSLPFVLFETYFNIKTGTEPAEPC